MSKFRTVVQEPMIDFFEVTDYLEEEKGMNYRRMPGDCWHWLLDHPFDDLHRNGGNYLSFELINSDFTPEHVKEFLTAFREAVVDHEAFDERANAIMCYIDW